MSSVWLAVTYIGGWILSMRIFGYFWKNRELAINNVEPWFKENVARNEYITLLQQTEPEATDAQLQAALVKRAVEGVIRVLSMREDKQVLASLVKQGTLGDDVWTQFTVSEKELESEVLAIIEEANTFKKGWGSTILQTASEMVTKERANVADEAMRRKKEEKELKKEKSKAQEELDEKIIEEKQESKTDEQLGKKKKKASPPGSKKK